MAIDNEKHLCDGELDIKSVAEIFSATAANGKTPYPFKGRGKF